MSAAMINVGLKRKSRFPIRNVTAQCVCLRYDCCNGTLLEGLAVRRLAFPSWSRPRPSHSRPRRRRGRPFDRTAMSGETRRAFEQSKRAPRWATDGRRREFTAKTMSGMARLLGVVKAPVGGLLDQPQNWRFCCPQYPPAIAP